MLTEESEDIKDIESINQVLTILRMHIVIVCTFQTYDITKMNEDVEECWAKTKKVVEKTSSVPLKLQILLNDVNKVSTVLGLMIDNMNALRLQVEDFVAHSAMAETTFVHTPKNLLLPTPPSLEADIDLSSSYSEDNPFLKYHRLSPIKVKVLEKWFKENSGHPYLTAKSSTLLVKETGLTHSQVKNWLSNKRRKHKAFHVSQELQDLLASS